MRGRRIIVDQINLIRINVIVTYKSDAIRQLKTLSIKFLYRNMDDDEEQCRVGLGHYRKKSGQKTCAHCSKSYNNYSIPPYCTCNFFLGGTFKKAVQKLDTKMLTGSLASTRVNIAGPNVRTFVLLGDNPKARISITNSLYFQQFTSKSQLNPCNGFIT